MIKFRLGFLTLLLFSSSTLNAVTYFAAPYGNDENDGSINLPWKNIAYSTSKLNNGDVLKIKSGIYYETSKVVIQRSNVSIIADDPLNRPTIDFQDSNDPKGNYIDGYGQSNITWDGVNVLNAGGEEKGAIDASVWNSTNNPSPILRWTIKNCRIEYAYNAAIRLFFCNDVVIENVTAFQCGQINADRKNTKNHPHIILGFWADNVTIKNSSIIQGHGEGVGPYIDCDNWLIEHCTVADNYAINVYVDSEKGNCVVRNNLIYNTDFYVEGGKTNQRASGIRIANEISDFQGWGGIYDPTKFLVQNVQIYNNVILNCHTGIEAFPYDNGPFTLTNSSISNNTIVGTTEGKNGLYIQVKGQMDVKNNLVFNTGGITLSSDCEAFGNYSDDPCFIIGTGLIAENYQLKPNSPCIDAGTYIPSILTDFNGNIRTVDNKFDLGAFEFIPEK